MNQISSRYTTLSMQHARGNHNNTKWTPRSEFKKSECVVGGRCNIQSTNNKKSSHYVNFRKKFRSQAPYRWANRTWKSCPGFEPGIS